MRHNKRREASGQASSYSSRVTNKGGSEHLALIWADTVHDEAATYIVQEAEELVGLLDAMTSGQQRSQLRTRQRIKCSDA